MSNNDTLIKALPIILDAPAAKPNHTQTAKQLANLRPHKKGVGRVPGSGRKKGTRNLQLQLKVEDYLAVKNINPVEILLRLIPQMKPEAAASAILELMKWVQPQYKPVDIGGPIQLNSSPHAKAMLYETRDLLAAVTQVTEEPKP